MQGFPCRRFVRITFESGESLIVHANLVRIAKADTSNNVPEEEFAQIILKVKDDPSYRISFRGSIVDLVGPTELSNVLCDDIINVSRNSSRSVVPTAAVLAAELLKRTTPPSVLGVPKCRKKL